MTKPFELSGVEAEKEEAMRRYNIRRTFLIIVRLAVVASLCYLWFPTVAISIQTAGDWFYRTGMVIIANRSVVFVVANLIVGLIFLFSGESNKESSSCNSKIEPDLYDQYTTSSSAVIVTSVTDKVIEEDDDSNKQIVPAIIAEVKEVVVKEPTQEVVVEQAKQETVTKKGIYRRTKSETTKKKIVRPVMEYRRTESAKVVAMERLSSEEFRLKVESFIMEKKRTIVQENDVVCRSRPWVVGDAASGYGSC